MDGSISVDGVSLHYEDEGTGTPAFLLVHGWCESIEYFARQAETLRGAHRVVAVDNRGHGRSDAYENDYSVSRFADDLAAVCARLDLSKPVVVGHSLGGAIVLELAARHPDLPAAIVALEGTILFPDELRAEVEPMVAALRTPAWRDVMHEYLESLFVPTDDAELLERGHREIDRLPQHVVAASAEGALAWDAEAAAKACSVPMLYIDAGGGLCDLAQLQELCPQLVVGKVVGVGHDQMLESPEQINAMIDRFLDVTFRPVVPAGS